MTNAAIDSGLFGDIYVSMGEPVDGGAWIIRVYSKPFITWVWGGFVMMAMGGFLAITDRRYRTAAQRDAALAQSAAVAAEEGPVHTMDTNALHGRKRPAQGAKAEAGREPGETLQRSDGRFRQQPQGSGRPGAPLDVVLLAKTPGLRVVVRLDWRPMPPARVRVHSVNRPRP